jgi:hypothetical protein
LKSSWIYSNSLRLATDLSANMNGLGDEFSEIAVSSRTSNATQLLMAMNKLDLRALAEE